MTVLASLALLHVASFSTVDAVHTILFLAVAGLCLWLLFRFVPMQPPFPTLITVVVVVLIILWILSKFGMI